jgi:tRNA-dihydrouridine synthase B
MFRFPSQFAIGPVRVAPATVLAPMAGVTDTVFRRFIRNLGGCGLLMTEFTSSHGVSASLRAHKPTRTLLKYLSFDPVERPITAQLFGADPAVMADAARVCQDLGFDVVDINFGCPVKEVTEKAHSGSYLLRYPDRVGRIVNAVAKACAPTPVTAKIRLGATRDTINACDIAQAVEDAGGAALTVHGRTAADMFNGSADWEEIALIKPALYRIPLIGNGDLTTPEAVVEAFRRYDVDGVMIGRGGLTRPWLFRQAAAALKGEPIPPEPTLAEQRQMLLDHYDLVVRRFGVDQGTILMRKFACCYAQAKPGARAFRAKVGKVSTAEEFLTVVRDYYPREAELSCVHLAPS